MSIRDIHWCIKWTKAPGPQAKKAEIEGYEKKLAEMEDVANLQRETADLDKCIAWSEATELRGKLHQLTATVEEQLPKEVDEVSPAQRLHCLETWQGLQPLQQ